MRIDIDKVWLIGRRDLCEADVRIVIARAVKTVGFFDLGERWDPDFCLIAADQIVRNVPLGLVDARALKLGIETVTGRRYRWSDLFVAEDLPKELWG